MGRWFGMARQFEAGDVQPVIDRRYDLGEVREAFTSLGSGHARWNTIITI
jgi:hypothetical protein